jgi:DNA-directed RNA polymerase subunit M/transcription elongation factor TFIIS|tara:strand:+ start:83 stop:622 length:540 start_codon:yes stop_codon:yes gene_type:complete
MVFSKDELNKLKEMRKKIEDKFFVLIKTKKKAKLIENSIYNYVIETNEKIGIPLKLDNNFKSLYIHKVITIYNNLNPNSKIVNNTYLLKEIKNDNIDLDKIAYLKPEELFPEHWEKYINKKQAIINFKYKENKYVVTDDYKCSRCKSTKCTYYTLQTRSCDEPETIIITCLNCKYTWKE